MLSWALAGLCVWLGFAAVGLVLAIFGVLLVRLLKLHHRATALFAPLAQARQALDAGDTARCEALLGQLAAARPPPEFHLWLGILRSHVAFNRGTPEAAATALSEAIHGPGRTLCTVSTLGAIVLALRALAYALLGRAEQARADLTAHDAHPARTADTIAPARLAEAWLLGQAGDGRAQAELVSRDATALLNRMGPAQRPLVRALAISANRRDYAYRTSARPDPVSPRANRAAPRTRIALRINPSWRQGSRARGVVIVAGVMALIVGAFWLPKVLAWQGLGVALLAVVAFVVYGMVFRRRRSREARQLNAARVDLIWGDQRRGHRQLVALAGGRDDEVAVDACVHLTIDAEERGDLDAALDACDAGLARIESGRAQLPTQSWTAPKLTELQAYLRAASGELARSQRELDTLRATFPDYAFLVAGVHRVRLMQAARARDWHEMARLEAHRAPAMTISARDELLGRVGGMLASGATREDLAEIRAELDAFPSYERWLDVVVPGALDELKLRATPIEPQPTTRTNPE